VLEGLYESLLTTRLQAQVDEAAGSGLTPRTELVDAAEQPGVFARHIRDAAARALAAESNPQRRREMVNALLVQLGADDDQLAVSPSQLLSLVATAAPGIPVRNTNRPATPLSDAALLTNAQGEPSLGHEIRSELDSADQVDLLCAFVKWYGLRVIESELLDLRRRRVPLRVITTTYMGATERIALDRLVHDFGAEVKIQYDSVRTRLHAKAWLFRRDTGFNTSYVGSSNLSRSAMLEGVEWNVRLSAVATPSLIHKFSATFETYWNDTTFETYDPDRDRDRLDDALAEASGRKQADRLTLSLSGLEVRPYPHQSEILELIQAERDVHSRHRNLVVAATGTGKTVIAALDYRRLSSSLSAPAGERPTLLFVAHREEILRQSLHMYREVLSDPGFGELYVGGYRPERWRHVFASVQSLTAYGVTNIPADAFDVVVIDEFHHAQATTYRRITDHLRPVELLGLTATPERADGTDVRSFFGGRVAAELRLWDALSADLLCPFHYFGVADGVDLSALEWSRGMYDQSALSGLYTGNDARARIILKQLHGKVADVHQMRALGFCVSIAHAEYMAGVFNKAGIPSLTVTSGPGSADRADALRRLASREINAIFTVDVFNEGVDIPAVDTVLFLRPTESATVFLQQLGRGLRRAQDKPVLTAIDFVGHQRKEFRFDTRYRAITGATKTGLQRQVENGFPFLPAGSQIVLERQAQEIVLANIKRQLSTSWKQIVAELRSCGDVSLADFLGESGLELGDVLKSDRSWTRLRREAGFSTRSGGAQEVALLRRVRALAHVDDADRARAYQGLLADDGPVYQDLDAAEQRYARMLFFSLWPNGSGFTSYDEGLLALRSERAARDELRTVVEIAFDRAQNVTASMPGGLSSSPLRSHARYSREEIVAALDYAHLARLPSGLQTGVLWAQEWRTDAFLITLTKSETDYSPTTMYQDYAISPSLFHWETQSRTSVTSPTGQRYLNHVREGSNVVLFARQHKTYDLGSAPYLCLGTGRYVSHSGDRPIAITWRLDRPMPTETFTASTVVA
jgi:superfamily II DNA or RNA helicase/HKD family nuclease